MSLNTDKLNKLQRLAPVRSSELLGDGQRIWNEHGELTCDVCGKHELGLGWPTPHLCMKCGRKRDSRPRRKTVQKPSALSGVLTTALSGLL